MPLASQSKFDPSSVEFHRNNPDVSLERHMRKKRIQLGAAVASVQRIYLDQRFWILLRDVSLGRSVDDATSELLAFLKLSVSEGRSVCPISESVFFELLKQSDNSTRLATAQLIDELSQGITLIPFHDRICQELCNSFYQQAGAIDLIPIQEMVWTKLIYVLGEVHPSSTPFPKKEELVIQKAFADHIWNVPLSEMVTQLSDPPTGLDCDSIAANLNTGNRAHFSTLRNYAHVFRIEFEGGLSLFRNEMDVLLKEIDQRGYKEFGAKLKNMSDNKKFEAFALSIPTLYVFSACHASVRWNKQRNLVGNDLFDFHHAQAALAYCDVFLTEKPLSDMLGQHHLGLTKFKCKTFWSPSIALTWLRENIG
jgi:hypothetical protein